MSFEKGGITYKEILDAPVLGYTSIDYLWAVKSNGAVFPVLKTIYAQADHAHTIISNGGEQFACTGSFCLIKCESPTQPIYFKTGGTGIATQPGGNGTIIYADGFAEHSMAKLKNNISTLPDNLQFHNILPKLYTIGGKAKIGFLAEEMPVEAQATHHNVETGVDEIGIDIMGVCALQQRYIQSLEQRIITLEKKVLT